MAEITARAASIAHQIWNRDSEPRSSYKLPESHARMAELVDAPDLGSGFVRSRGSSPLPRTFQTPDFSWCHPPGSWGHVSPGPWGQVTGIEDRRIKCHKSPPLASPEARASAPTSPLQAQAGL